MDYVYGADFETDHDGTRAWVCQWAMAGPTGAAPTGFDDAPYESHGYDIEGFHSAVEALLAQANNRHRIYIYFHNLRFDIQFMRGLISDWCERLEGSQIVMRDRQPIYVRLGRYLQIRDSAMKMPGKLRALGKSIGIPKLYPPDEDFSPGWSSRLTDEDFPYVIRDAVIPAVAMTRMHRSGARSSTFSGDAWKSCVEMWAVAHGTTGQNYYQYYHDFKTHYPPLDEDADRILRRAYFGGINVSQHKGVTIGDITHEDVHSMYPSVISMDLLPYGPPVLTQHPERYPLWIMRASLKLTLKPHGISWFKFRSLTDCEMEGLKWGNPVISCEYYHELTLSCVDLQTLSEHYVIDIDDAEPVDFWGFRGEIGALKSYIDRWYQTKSESGKGTLEYHHAKLMLNSCYGRFGMRADSEIIGMEWKEDLSDWDFCVERVEESDPTGYLPLAIFVTAHARRRLMECCCAVGTDRVIHCDTDSVIHLGQESPMGHDDILGDWGIESRPARIYEGGFKRYVEFMQYPPQSLHDVSMACAGVPQNIDERTGIPVGMWVELLDNPELITADGYILGQEHYCITSEWLRSLYLDAGANPDDVDTRKLLPHKVPGGVILQPSTYNLSDNLVVRIR